MRSLENSARTYIDSFEKQLAIDSKTINMPRNIRNLNYDHNEIYDFSLGFFC